MATALSTAPKVQILYNRVGNPNSKPKQINRPDLWTRPC